MGREVMILRYVAVGLVVCGSVVIGGVVSAQNQSLVLENFQAKEADGFPSNFCLQPAEQKEYLRPSNMLLPAAVGSSTGMPQTRSVAIALP